MSQHVNGSNIAEAWVNAFSALSAAKDHEIVNLTVTIENPGLELLNVRQRLDLAVAELKAAGRAGFDKSVHTVANTIFPMSLYRAGRPDAFYTAVRESQSPQSRFYYLLGREERHVRRAARHVPDLWKGRTKSDQADYRIPRRRQDLP